MERKARLQEKLIPNSVVRESLQLPQMESNFTSFFVMEVS